MASKRKYWLACGVALSSLPALPAVAQPRTLNIPSEEAAKSIPEFARQENIQIIAPVSQLHGINTQAVSGSMALDEALKTLLVGTGLEVASDDGLTIVLRRGESASVMPAARESEDVDSEPPLVESIIVTGSRVISDAANSPTPVTLISSKQLHDTTPSNLADGLNKLPIFQGSQTIGRPGDGSQNFSSNTLNLRNFGDQRTLVLLDGHRATPSNSDGSVDIDTLPQMLVTRIDIVTGGASAVYGSDAVTGVVNFVLDRKFDGLKTDFNTGISTYADAMSYNLGIAAGSDLFGGRGHYEASIEYRHRDPVNQSARPYGPTTQTAENGEAGSGTAADPYNVIVNARRPNSTFGGLVQGCNPACPTASMMQFNTAGQLVAYYPGVTGATNAAGQATAGSSNFNSGGEGAYNPYGDVFDGYHQGTLFSRFSYDLASNITFYVQGQAAESYSFGWYFPQKIQPGINQADIFYKNNPFLTAAEQVQLGNNPALQTTQLSSSVQAGNTFQLGEFLVGNGQTEINATGSVNRVLSVQTGFDGTLMNGRFNWNLFYTHGENRLAVDLVNNQNLQNMYASEDAVLTPSGTVACYASTEGGAIGAQYANCVPINPFGANSVSASAFKYDFQTTDFHETNTLNNLGGAISGKVLDDWAGPITAALSGEARFNAYDVSSNVPSSTYVNCAGLRICNPALPSYAQSIIQAVHASENVWEFALETEVPVIKDVPLIQNFDLNMAGRYTDYSVSGSVQTWKAGFNWNVVDSFRFRGTTSIDIRAPTLNDLFQPATLVQNVFNGDLHIPIATPAGQPQQYASYTTTYSSQGNPKLMPEVARTYTVGAVWTPDFISGLTVSLDYYRIHLANAIGQIAPSSTIQSICEASNGTSIYCANYQRPFVFSDHTTDNDVTKLYTFNLNTASTKTEGWDFETNYGWQMSDLVEGWKGSWNTRLLATYEPVINNSVLIPGQAFTRTPDPSTRITWFLNYSLNDWSVGVEDEWVSGFSQVAGPVTATINNWVNPHVNAWNQVDLNISRNFILEGADMTGYFVVQNFLNAQPAYVPNGTIGQWYPVYTSGYSVQSPMGRYFTVGVRANL